MLAVVAEVDSAAVAAGSEEMVRMVHVVLERTCGRADVAGAASRVAVVVPAAAMEAVGVVAVTTANKRTPFAHCTQLAAYARRIGL